VGAWSRRPAVPGERGGCFAGADAPERRLFNGAMGALLAGSVVLFVR
jgi:hypothetical protein